LEINWVQRCPLQRLMVAIRPINTMEEKNEDIETSENNEELEESTEEVEETNDELETEEESDSPTLEDFNEAKAKLKELEEKNKQLYARLKKGEQKPLQTNNKTEITEEQLLKAARMANTLDDDDLEVLKTITGNSVADKMDNPLFKAYNELKEKKKRSEASALKPSSPGNYSSDKKNPNNPNLSDEEHRKLVEKLMS